MRSETSFFIERGDGTAFAELTKGYIVSVSADDIPKVNNLKWYASISNDGKVYAKNIKSIGDGKRTSIYLHRIILGAKRGEYADHINGDTLDCRRENLRIVTNQQNSFNSTAMKSNKKSSQYKGVTYIKPLPCRKSRQKRWLASVKLNKKVVWSKSFMTEIEAAEAYKEAAIRIHGETNYFTSRDK